MPKRDITQEGLEDSAQGKAKQVKGRVKDAAGGLTGDTSMQVEGKVDQAKGKVQDAAGKVERHFGKNRRSSP
ncbi:MAG TPA: CsbD family protein [Gemmatimonadales bacterium]|nr:CsbD family protein [Gemmatimonadales bacterium]